MSHKEDEIVQKVEYILNYSTEIKQDKALQQFLNFNFTNEFKNKILTLPVKKSEKESFKFIEQYVSLVYSLFKLKKEERITLYSSPIPLTKDYNNISQNINQLNKIIDDKKEYIYEILKDKQNPMNIIMIYLYNHINDQQKTLVNKLDEFHFYFIFYVTSTSSLKFLLYSIIKNQFSDVLEKFDYQDFCPNLNKEACQNLIILFFENIQNEKREFLFIFALLIFEYEVIFKYRLDQKIPKYILLSAAKKTYEIVELKTLKNGLICEYTYNEFLLNLDITVIQLQEKNRKLANSSKKNLFESAKQNFPIIHLKNNNDGNIEEEIQAYNKAEQEKKNIPKNDKKIINTDEINENNLVSPIPEKNEINSQKNNNPNKDEISEEITNELKIEDKRKIIENKNMNDINIFKSKKEEEKLPEIKNNSNIINSKEKENSKDFMNLSEKEINELNIQSLYYLIKSKLSEMEKENEQKFLELESKINSLKDIVGNIQIRSLAKNFLKIFKNGFNQDEKEKIQKDKSKKDEVTLESLKRKYSNYVDKENFKTVSELIKKSGKALNKDNDFAYSQNLKDYKEEIMQFKEKLNIKLDDVEILEKIIFLKKIGISDSNFNKCFEFLAKYCGKEMKLKFLGEEDNIKTFIEGDKENIQ